jgi:hypothetical protein
MKDKICKIIDAEIKEMRETFLAFSGLYNDISREEMIEALFDGWEARKEILVEENPKPKDGKCKCGAARIDKHFSYPISKKYKCGSVEFTDGSLEESALCREQSRIRSRENDQSN